MKREKYLLLQEILYYGTYSVNYNDGEIYNNNTGEKIGYIKYVKRSKTGLKMVSLWHNKKKYTYTVAEIIMAELGHINLKNCEKLIVENMSRDARNTHYTNLRVMSRTDLCKLEHRKKLISSKTILTHQYKPLPQEKKQEIKALKVMGFRPNEIHKITDINKNTVIKYFYKRGVV